MRPRNWIGTYILDDAGNPVPATTLEWATWSETHERHVAVTNISSSVRVSTIFLGLDHNLFPMLDPLTYKPVLWETMIFGGPLDQCQERYTSVEDARAGHKRAVDKAREAAFFTGSRRLIRKE